MHAISPLRLTSRDVSPCASGGGWLLVGLIIILSAVLIGLGGVTVLLVSHLRQISLRQNETKAITLAHAGVMQAIYDFRFNTGGNGVAPGTFDAVPGDAGLPGLADDNVFVLAGAPADFLLANMIPAVLDQSTSISFGVNSRDQLRLWRLRNARTGAAIQINFLTVSWNDPHPELGEGIARVEINGVKVWPQGVAATSSVAPGIEFDITDVSIPAATERIGNVLYFATSGAGSPMPGKAFIQMRFRMSDDSARVARYAPAAAMRSGSFTIRSAGEVRQGVFPFLMRRRLQAEYRLNQLSPTNLQQVGNIVSDLGLLIAPAVAAADERPGYRELAQ